jgi:NAD+ diphosphatase
MRYKYCPNCGKKLTKIHAGDDGMVPYCEPCDKRWFDSFQSCVIVLVYNEFDEIVLSKQWYLSDEYTAFTSGFIKPGENAEECAVREVKEEIGQDIENLEYAGTYWLGMADQLMHGFIAYTKKNDLVLSEEISAADWVPALDAPKTMFPDKPGGPLYEVYHKFLKMRGLEES